MEMDELERGELGLIQMEGRDGETEAGERSIDGERSRKFQPTPLKAPRCLQEKPPKPGELIL